MQVQVQAESVLHISEQDQIVGYKWVLRCTASGLWWIFLHLVVRFRASINSLPNLDMIHNRVRFLLPPACLKMFMAIVIIQIQIISIKILPQVWTHSYYSSLFSGRHIHMYCYNAHSAHSKHIHKRIWFEQMAYCVALVMQTISAQLSFTYTLRIWWRCIDFFMSTFQPLTMSTPTGNTCDSYSYSFFFFSRDVSSKLDNAIRTRAKYFVAYTWAHAWNKNGTWSRRW